MNKRPIIDSSFSEQRRAQSSRHERNAKQEHRWHLITLILLLAALPGGWAATFTVVNTNSSGPGSLFQAINSANTNAGPDIITFNIAPGGPQTIAGGLPNVTDPVTIDATTQPGFSGSPIVEISGGGTAPFGFIVNAGNNIIRGFALNGFNNTAVYFAGGSSSNRLEGCWIGLRLNGSLVHSNMQAIVIDNGRGNVIGGTNAAARNVIAGAVFSGVYIYEGKWNSILGNYIGTDISGSNAIGNGWRADGGANDAAGIHLDTSVSNIIGGVESGARNLIGGNTIGILVRSFSTANTIQGNWIGLDSGGAAPLAGRKQVFGIRLLTSDANIIGGTVAGAGNVISGHAGAPPFQTFDGYGISVFSSGLNTIQGNRIGTDVSGTQAVPNSIDGIQLYGVSRTNTIGGTTAGARNIISGNLRHGIFLRDAYNNNIQGNYIGTQADGASPMGNGENGVFLYSGSGNNIGGTTAGSGNVIAFNGIPAGPQLRNGITLTQLDPFTSSSGNLIRRNSIFSNGDRGIRLYDPNCSFCTVHNDTNDGDSGPNDLQNTPVLTNAVTSGGSIAISGRLHSKPNTAYTLEFFANPEINGTGYGEGKTYLGSTAVVTDGSGNAGFETFFVDNGYTGQFISATATDPSRNTSEFAADVVADGPAGALQFAQPSYTFGEGSYFVNINVVRVGGSEGIVTVHYSTSNDTATAGSDYIGTSGMLTFTNGETAKTLLVQLLDDSLNEADERFFLALDTPTGGAILGPQATIPFVITDSDPILIYAGDSAATKPPAGSTTMTFPVSLSQVSTRTISVWYLTANITAEAGIDYLSATGRLDFVPGVTTQFVSVTVLTDGLQEGSKSFLLTLQNPTNAVLGDGQALGTIYDGTQGVLQFSAASYTSSESAVTATITVTRTGGSLGTVSVPFSAISGTAIAGNDFVATNGVLTFNNGQASRSFSVPLNDDGTPEDNETVQLQLGTPSGTSLGAPASALLTILDNDTSPWLSIHGAGSNVVLRWPTQAVTFQLARADSIPTTNWNPVTNAPVIVGTNFVVTNSASGDSRFYRLQQ
jgi:parallel beta-helix repeat protein